MTFPATAHPRPFPAACVALLCVGTLCVCDARERKPRPPAAASTPSTAQILAPAAATVPDALPVDRQVWRCGNRYSAHPCEGRPGAAPLAVADDRSEAQRRQADEIVKRDERLAQWYAAGRRERAQAASAPAQRPRAASAVAGCASTLMMSCVPRKPRVRTVVAPGAASGALRR